MALPRHTEKLPRNRRTASTNQLDALKQYTRVVADTADFAAIREYAPEDATTNPSLILKATQMPGHADIVERALAEGRRPGLEGQGLIEHMIRELLVSFGLELLKIVPGRISVETRAAFAFNPQALITEARELIREFERRGIGRERILIKLASTWEGIQAAATLEREEIHCNMTLLFSLAQAAACAEVGATLISPFVGRILDWHRKNTGREYTGPEDPGVLSVREIYDYCKAFDYPVEVMGASFRNKEEILELAGCDLLTISPDLLEELQNSTEPVARKLEKPADRPMKRLQLDEPSFRWMLNSDAMATEKLAEGIRNFHRDTLKLADFVAKRIGG